MKLPNIKLSPFLKNIILTFSASIITIICIILLTRILAKALGPDSFGTYCVARRLVSLVIPFSTLSMGVSLTRYISVANDQDKKVDYLLSAMSIVFFVSLLFIGVSLFAANYLSSAIFHSNESLTLFYVCLFMIGGFGVYTILYSYYRGIQNMISANLWQICVVAILPLGISYIFAHYQNISLIIFFMGLVTYLSIFPLIIIVKGFKKSSFNQIRIRSKELISYGLPRTPGGLTFAGFLTVGPFFAPYFGSMRDAGYLVIGQSVFRILETSVVAFGLVALPKVSQILLEGKTEYLKKIISDILSMITHLGLFMVIQLFAWSKEIVLIWLGDEYLTAVPIIKIFLIALCPYLSYVMLRSIIDAVEEKAINTLNLFISFGIMIVACLAIGSFGFGVIGLAIGIAIGFLSLGIFSSYFLIRRYMILFNGLELVWILIFNFIIAAATITTKKYLILYFDDKTLLSMIFFSGFIFFLFYIWLLYKKNIQWVLELKKRAISSAIKPSL